MADQTKLKRSLTGTELLLIGVVCIVAGGYIIPGVIGALIAILGLICVALSIPAYFRGRKSK